MELAHCQLLAAIHLNDNGYHDDHEGKLAVMDIFGIDVASVNPDAKFQHTFNKDVSDP